MRIGLSGETRKVLMERLRDAYADRAVRAIRRIHALLGLGEGKSVWEMAQLLGA